MGPDLDAETDYPDSYFAALLCTSKKIMRMLKICRIFFNSWFRNDSTARRYVTCAVEKK
jgi:hypothetical protein